MGTAVLRAGAAFVVGFVSFSGTLACGEPVEGEHADPIGVRSEALKFPEDPNGPLEFEGWSQLRVPTFTMDGTPSLTNCDAHCLVAFQRSAADTGNQFWGLAAEGASAGTWAQYDTRSFGSYPAVVRFRTIGTERRILVVGRGAGAAAASRRIFWSTGRVTPVGNGSADFNPPEKMSEFQQINTNSFEDPYGLPVLAASSSGTVVMAYMGLNASSQARIYAQRKPYNSDPNVSNWNARVEAPALPSSFTPVGTPTITWGYAGNLYTIVVRAQRSGFSDRFYRIFFNGTAYSDPFGNALWQQLALPAGSPAIGSSPAVEWNDFLFTHTVYYRSVNFLYQASFIYDTLEEVPKIITTNGGVSPSFMNAPAVNGNLPFEIGQHWVLGRASTGRLWFTASHDDESAIVP